MGMADRVSARVDLWLERVGAAQAKRAWVFVLVAFAMGAACVPLILRLELNSDLTAMLPESTASVRDLETIQERFGGHLAMTLSVEADDPEALHRFMREFAPRIEARRDLKVSALDWNVADFERFVTSHRHLYAHTSDLEEIRDALQARLDYERARANPFYIDLDEAPPPDPQVTIDRMQSEAREAQREMRERYPEGFFQHPERSLVLVIVHTRIRGASEDIDALRAGIASEAAAISPQPAGLRVRYGGILNEVREETAQLESAMLDSLLLTLALVAVSILIFFLRWRPVPLLVLVLVPPVLITFGFAELTVDYLNASSAFLSSIVIGNGINPSIVWLARYFEERRAGSDVASSVAISHRQTWKGTITATLAAAVAYGSLMSTDYRGFRDFGVVGGVGMLLCWLAAYGLLPALAVIFERFRPLKFAKSKEHKGFYGVLFAKIALARPGVTVLASLLFTLAMGASVVWAVVENPLEFDYSKMQSARDPNGDIVSVNDAARAVLNETATGSSLAVLAPTHDDAARYRRQLEDFRRAHPNDFGALRSIDDLLPEDQTRKIAVLAELRSLMLEIRPHLTEEQQRLIDEQLPPERLAPLGPDDLPQSVARGFTERDGTRGRMLFVESNPAENNFDGRYMIRWAAAARSLRLPGTDRSPPVAGTGAVFADLIETVWREAPRAITVALGATIVLLLVTFRAGRERWLTLVSLLIGIVWMAGICWLMGMRLNFLNIIAFPITFGNGVDYAVNVMRRYVEERERTGDRLLAIRISVEGTGGAVILCALTTVIGYFSLHTSTNQALQSFGNAMGISEVACLLAAVVALPAAVHWFAGRRGKTAQPVTAPEARPSEV